MLKWKTAIQKQRCCKRCRTQSSQYAWCRIMTCVHLGILRTRKSCEGLLLVHILILWQHVKMEYEKKPGVVSAVPHSNLVTTSNSKNHLVLSTFLTHCLFYHFFSPETIVVKQSFCIACNDFQAFLGSAEKCANNANLFFNDIGDWEFVFKQKPWLYVSPAWQCLFFLGACESYPCQNGGQCVDTCSGGYECKCSPNWEGRNCEMSKCKLRSGTGDFWRRFYETQSMSIH